MASCGPTPERRSRDRRGRAFVCRDQRIEQFAIGLELGEVALAVTMELGLDLVFETFEPRHVRNVLPAQKGRLAAEFLQQFAFPMADVATRLGITRNAAAGPARQAVRAL